MIWLVIGLAARGLIFAVFAVACLSKIRSRADWQAFRRAIASLTDASPRLAGLLASGVAFSEALIVCILLSPEGAAVGFVGAAALASAFSVLLLRAIRRGGDVSCACFGRRASQVGVRHVFRNGLIATAAVAGLAASLAGDVDAGSPPIIVTALAVLVGCMVALPLVLIDDVLYLFGSTAKAIGPIARR
jgi:hypothetical protein